MKYSTNRHDETAKEAKRLSIYIGDTKFTLSESVDGKLTINKHHLENTELIVFSRYTNEIEIK